MAYVKTTWANSPAGTSFINATNLNKIEDGIYNNDIKSTANQMAVNSGLNVIDATLTYASSDSPTFNVTSDVDLTPYLSEGAKILLEQSQALTGYWSFDTNSTPEVGGFTMTNIGTPTYTAGKFGNALTLNGTNQALAITDTALLKPTGAFTIGCWIKTGTTATFRRIFQSFSINPNRAGIAFSITTTNVLEFLTADNTGASSSSSILGTTNVCDNNLHYVEFTYNNNYGQIYVDGNLEASGYMVSPVYAATNYVRIGCSNTTGSNVFFFGGQIDDLFLINGYALDEKTIRDKYEANTAQGSGNIAIDKWFLLHAINTTTLTLYGGTDFQLMNSAITNPRFSLVKSPAGYNGNCDKWSVTITDTTQRSQITVGTTTYNLGGINIVIPIGLFKIRYDVVAQIGDGGKAIADKYMTFGLSTANNTIVALYSCSIAGSNTKFVKTSANKEFLYDTNTKTTLYMNAKDDAGAGETIYFLNGGSGQPIPLVIKATSIYC